VGISADGTELAWSTYRASGPPDIAYGSLDNDVIGPVTRVPAMPPGQTWEDNVLGIGDLTWAADDALIVSSSVDDDVNGSVALVPLKGAARRGWTNGDGIQPDAQRPVMEGAVSATVASRVLITMSGANPTVAGDSVAAEVDVRTGKVTSVIATAAVGRGLFSISGGARGVLYRTSHWGEHLRTYWRQPGAAHGVLLSGLPVDAHTVVAQS
jgi:hypothetical protein